MRKTERTGQTPEQTYTETTVGDAPSSVEVSFTAKGLAQPTYKLYFASPEDMRAQVRELLQAVHAEVAAAVHEMGARLVSEPEPAK